MRISSSILSLALMAMPFGAHAAATPICDDLVSGKSQLLDARNALQKSLNAHEAERVRLAEIFLTAETRQRKGEISSEEYLKLTDPLMPAIEDYKAGEEVLRAEVVCVGAYLKKMKGQ